MSPVLKTFEIVLQDGIAQLPSAPAQL